tara:strand:- start:998 stop:1354 length:357 start_codon:yes stop_codon:yes gene_type:complete
MENSIEKPEIEQTNGHGGARKGAGRPKGNQNTISVKQLLDELLIKSGGQHYEEILVEDFLACRNEGDKQTTLKYHNLILNKVMNSLAKIEVTDSADAVATKQAAFAEALAKLTGVKND